MTEPVDWSDVGSEIAENRKITGQSEAHGTNLSNHGVRVVSGAPKPTLGPFQAKKFTIKYDGSIHELTVRMFLREISLRPEDINDRKWRKPVTTGVGEEMISAFEEDIGGRYKSLWFQAPQPVTYIKARRAKRGGLCRSWRMKRHAPMNRHERSRKGMGRRERGQQSGAAQASHRRDGTWCGQHHLDVSGTQRRGPLVNSLSQTKNIASSSDVDPASCEVPGLPSQETRHSTASAGLQRSPRGHAG